MRETTKRQVARKLGGGILATGAATLCVSLSAIVATPVAGATTGGGVVQDVPRPTVQQSDCPDNGSLYVHNGSPLIAWNQSINTGIQIPAGTLIIDRFYSWDGYQGRSAIVQANEQWAVRVGSATSSLTPDLPDGVESVLITGALGSMAVSAGELTFVHSSLVGPTDGSPNSVHPVAVCYRVVVPETTVPTVPTSVSTTTSTTVAPTIATTLPPDTTVATTAPATTAATTTPTTAVTSTAIVSSPATNPDPVLTRPVATVAVVTTATTAAPTTQPATTAAPTSATPASTPTTAAAVAVLSETVEAPIVEEPLSLTGSSTGATVGFGLGMLVLGGVAMRFGRRQTTTG